MVNKKGGKKYKKKKTVTAEVERPLEFKAEGQEYCQVVKLLGNCRLEGNCFDGKTRLCHICGSMRKKVWLVSGDIVLVSLREFEDAKCDVIYKYTIKESRILKSYGEIPETVKINEAVDKPVPDDEVEDDIGIDFEEADYEEKQQEFKKDFDKNFKNI
jgi:translation initiation factor 1A